MISTGEILKKYRLRKKITAMKMAEKLAVSQPFYSGLETNKKKVSKKILDILRVILPQEDYEKILIFEEQRNIPGYIKEEINEHYKKDISKERRIVLETGEIPFYKEIKASAGAGAWNDEYWDGEYIEVPKQFSKKGYEAILVSGDSMYPEIKDKDIIIINKNFTEEQIDKKIGVICYDGEVYVKRIVKEEQVIQLESINPYYPKIEIKEHIDFKIIGVVVYLSREY